MKKAMLGVAVLAIVAGLGFTPMLQDHKSTAVSKAADFKSDDYKGNEVKLADFKGKVLVVHHVAPGCRDCNKQLDATTALRKKYGKDNLKSILFIYDGAFGKNRDTNKGMVKNMVENGKSPFDTRTVPTLDFDAYLVWDHPIYTGQLGRLKYKKEPILTCIIDPDGNFAIRQADRPIPQEEMDTIIGKFLKPVNGEAPKEEPKEEPKKTDDEIGKEEPKPADVPKEEPKGDDLDPQTAADLFKEAIEQLQEKKYDESIAAFKRISDKFGKEEIGFTSAYNVACGYALKGDKVQALEWLEKAMNNGFEKYDHIKQDTDLDSLRDEPKYKDLMSKEPM